MSALAERPSAAAPVAVIGMSCRLPGATGPEEFWRLLSEGREAVAEAPEDRRPADDGTGRNRRGGFLADVDRFDAEFFGLSPAEAAAMDPQQRLVLELAWEAIEHARIVPAELRGAAAGVFIGAITGDYALIHDRLGAQALGRHSVTGTHRSIIANRVSHLLGLRGPSLAVDSGQSSALVAVRLACEELRRGTARVALAGGVNLNLLPESDQALERFGALSPDGRCHTFDSRANGYVRGEGGGLVLLKPLADALADGDTVHCVILGGAVNSGTGEHLTVPDARAQREVVRLACRDAGVAPGDVAYVELHGTGTAVGDPIEAAGLGAALDTAARAAAGGAPLLVGSAKTNVGHLEGAAGIVGLLKVALSLSHRTLAPSLNFETPHPAIAAAAPGIEVVTTTRPWPPTDRPIAGVSAFGMGGTNCHLLLTTAPEKAEAGAEAPDDAGGASGEAPGRADRTAGGAASSAAAGTPSGPGSGAAPGAPTDTAPAAAAGTPTDTASATAVGAATETAPAAPNGPASGAAPVAATHAASAAAAGTPGADIPWLVSGRSPRALAAQAEKLVAHLGDRPGTRAADVALSLLRTRTAFAHRAVVLGADSAELDQRLGALAAGRPDRKVFTGRAVEGGRGFVFPGQGSQWPEMARELLDGEGPFAVRIAECARALAPYTDYDLLDVLRGAPDAPGFERVDVVQPALWAVMVSLAQVWRAAGVEPDLVMGHSQGEIAAATVIGALTLDDAARVVALRSQVLRQVTGGRMLSVSAPREVVEARLASYGEINVSVLNSPGSTVVSGPPEQLTALAASFDTDGFRTSVVKIDYASHSPAVDAIRDEVLAVLAPIRPVAVDIPFYSSLEGGRVEDTSTLDAEFWYRNLRHAVRFSDATRAALADGCGLFVECSPHPMLGHAIEETAEDAGYEAAAVGTLRRGAGGPAQLLRALAEGYVRGAAVDWAPLAAAPGARTTDLPTYAFQRERHWLGGTPVVRTTTAAGPVATDTRPTAAAAAPHTPESVRSLVAASTAAVLGHADSATLDPRRSFKDLGLDSQGTVELRNRLKEATGLRLPTTLLFEFPTPKRLADHLAGLLADGSAEPAAAPATPFAPVAPATDSRAADALEPIAIVAMSCRYPGGVATPEELWQLVATGTDATSGPPSDRGWDLDALLGAGPGRPGTLTTTGGGFLHSAPEFDAAFFGISPREALAMDPQQRLLLETSWEAVERAGIDPAGLAGQPVGVFVGSMASDYGPPLHQPGSGADGHLLTGTALSVISGRVAYTLGLRGPALTVDTACSSSLVAVHLAVRSLRAGECPMALAGGVTVMSTPGNLVEFSRQHGLAADGRAKAFSADADGTSFAEGAGVLLLERLSDARRNGHPVLAVIRGTAVNQDGASNGLTAPDGQAQRQLVHRALADARLTVDDIDAIEAHGTGTSLGDPVEANALIATYGSPGDGTDPAAAPPVWLGSVKANIGHTQAAAGVAGVIKMVQALRHETLPRTLHADEPTPRADWDAGRIRLLSREQAWPRGARVRRAAVSSFGISGTNAHLVVEEPAAADLPTQAPADTDPFTARPVTADRTPQPAFAEGLFTAWPITARTPESLREQARRLAGAVGGARTADVARTLAGRTVFAHRAVVLGGTGDDLAAGLRALADGGTTPGTVTGAARTSTRTALLFTGQGGQRLGMGRELHAAFPEFAQAYDEVCAAFDPWLDRPLREVLWADPDSPDAVLLDETRYTQPALFAFETAAWRLLRSLGVEADTVAGHSVGEYAAACAAGVWQLDDAVRLVAARGRLMQQLPRGGAMFAVAASEEELRGTLAEPAYAARPVGLAAVNGPRSCVVSGEERACEEIAAHWAGLGRRTKRLTVSHAFHSPLMEPMLDAFRQEVAATTLAEPQLPYASALGADRSWTDPAYWMDQIRDAVLFAPLVDRLAGDGVGVFFEVGPQAVLTPMARESLAGRTGTVVSLARRGRDEREALLHGLAEAFVAGTPVGWERIAGDGALTDLPTYAFDRRRFWLTDRATGGDGAPALPRTSLLRRATSVAADGGHLLGGRLSLCSTPWLADHTIGGTVVVPGTALVECALQAAELAGAAGVGGLTLLTPLTLPALGAVEVQVAVGGEDAGGRRTLTVHARPADEDAPWTAHATGHTTPDGTASEASWAAAWPPPGAQPFDLTDGYDRLAAAGYGYGPAFQGLVGAWRSGTELYADVRLPEHVRSAAGDFTVHPALLDAVLHILVLDAQDTAPSGGRPVPFSFTDVAIGVTGADALRVRLTPAPSGDGIRMELCDTTGRPVGETTVSLRNAPEGFGLTTTPPSDTGLFDVTWLPTDLPPTDADSTPWTVLGTGPRAESTAAALRESGRPASVVTDLDALSTSHAPGTPAGSGTTGSVAATPGTSPAAPDGLTAVNAPAVLVVPAPEDPDDPATHDIPSAVRRVLADALALVRRRVTDPALAGTRLLFLADPDSLTGAPLWGLLRSAQTEHPDAFALAHATGTDPREWPLLAAALAHAEPQTAVRGTRLLVPRLTLHASQASGDATVTTGAATDADSGNPTTTGGPGTPAPAVTTGPSTTATGPATVAHPGAPEHTGAPTLATPGGLGAGTVLVTGGTGGLGARLAVHLVERHGVRDLLLVSRRGAAAEGAEELAVRLGELGATVRVEACDVSDRAALAALLGSVPGDRPLTGVVHTAGVLDDGLVAQLDGDRLGTVLGPKADAAWLLHELTAELPLSAFVLYSSIAGVLGNAGQAGYAAANGFLDALAAHRRAAGLPAASLAWGLWSAEAGMATALSAVDQARLARIGTLPLDQEHGLALFDAALAADLPNGRTVAARWDLAGLRARAASGAAPVPPLLRTLVPAPRPARTTTAATAARTAATAPAAGGTGLTERLAGLDRKAAHAVLLDLVRERAAVVLGHDRADRIETDRPFTELGFDSLAAVELQEGLGRMTGIPLPATLTFDHPTVADVAARLAETLAPATSRPAAAADDRPWDTLDSALSALLDGTAPAGPQERSRTEALLRAALRRLRDSPATPGLPGIRDGGGRADGTDHPLTPELPGGGLASVSLATVSDEDLFDFIDNQL
ncbi:SDR family NAD(P)-dependent oxidoreductase [Streptomyces sp. NPDC051976]|uniref:type I polyketide synthase n=1 Tax=Streptomyces sp. NPDC051976 TaxID=3154947 RepID=UPI0034499409